MSFSRQANPAGESGRYLGFGGHACAWYTPLDRASTVRRASLGSKITDGEIATSSSARCSFPRFVSLARGSLLFPHFKSAAAPRATRRRRAPLPLFRENICAPSAFGSVDVILSPGSPYFLLFRVCGVFCRFWLPVIWSFVYIWLFQLKGFNIIFSCGND